MRKRARTRVSFDFLALAHTVIPIMRCDHEHKSLTGTCL